MRSERTVPTARRCTLSRWLRAARSSCRTERRRRKIDVRITPRSVGLEDLPLEAVDALVDQVEDREVRVDGPVHDAVVEDLRALAELAGRVAADGVPQVVERLPRPVVAP